MASSKRTKNPHAGGTVDFDAVKPRPQSAHNGFWRLLKNRKTGETLKIFGYAVNVDHSAAHTLDCGPWVGYTEESLKTAPCNHCGRTGNLDRLHVCPGFYLDGPTGDPGPPVCAYDGMRSNDGEHVCVGRPSMSYHGVSHFKREEWLELSVNRFAPLKPLK